MNASAEMPKYKCHKEVHALKIERVEETGEWGTLHFFHAGFAPMRVSNEYMAKHDPVPGGYYVIYKDGYRSYSPAKAFEDGYTQL